MGSGRAMFTHEYKYMLNHLKSTTIPGKHGAGHLLASITIYVIAEESKSEIVNLYSLQLLRLRDQKYISLFILRHYFLCGFQAIDLLCHSYMMACIIT